MAETLDLDKAIDDINKETPAEEIPKEEAPKEETPKEEKPSSEETPKEDKPKEEEADPFTGLTEITELNRQFVTLQDGKRVKITDLIDGNMRSEDYTQKTMELSESRRQLDLARNATTVDTTKEQKTAIDLTEQNKTINEALAQMDATDPMAIIMKGIFEQNNHVIEFINNQEVSNREQTARQATEADNVNAKRLISEALDKESKSYNLPTIKDADGGETNMKALWNELVLTELQANDQNVNLAQFNHLVNQIGKTAYARLRTIISVANATKPKEESADETKGSQKETKPKESTEETPKTEVHKEDKGLPLNKRIENAMERLEQNK